MRKREIEKVKDLSGKISDAIGKRDAKTPFIAVVPKVISINKTTPSSSYIKEYAGICSEEELKRALQAIMPSIPKSMKKEAWKAIENSRKVFELASLDAAGVRFFVKREDASESSPIISFKRRMMELLTGRKQKRDSQPIWLDDEKSISSIAWSKIDPSQENLLNIEDDKRLSREEPSAFDRTPPYHKARTRERDKEGPSEELVSFRIPGSNDRVVGTASAVEKAVSEYQAEGWSREDLEMTTVSPVEAERLPKAPSIDARKPAPRKKGAMSPVPAPKKQKQRNRNRTYGRGR